MRKTALLLIGLSFITSYEISKPGKIDKPSNFILFIGDGMGLTHIYAGMTRSEHPLNMYRFSNIGLVETYSSAHYITDSGAGATAYLRGKRPGMAVWALIHSGMWFLPFWKWLKKGGYLQELSLPVQWHMPHLPLLRCMLQTTTAMD